MWSAQKDEAIVLAVFPWKEADRRYVALTKQFGKIEFIGRGASKGRAKLASHLEPCAKVNLELIVGRSQTTVIGVERVNTFFSIHQTLEYRLLVETTSIMLCRVLYDRSPDLELYRACEEFLEFLDTQRFTSSSRTLFIWGSFFLRVLSHLGYNLELHACLDCRERIQPLAFRWHDIRGGLLCTECFLRAPEQVATARLMQEEAVTMLRFARGASYKDLLKAPLRGDEVVAFSECIHDMLRLHVPGYGDTPYWEYAMLGWGSDSLLPRKTEDEVS